MKILIAEDDIDFGNILSQYVTLSGFEVVLGRNGREAWDLFRSEKPDICVLDVMMPEMDGFTLAGKMREEEPGIPFIFLTAKSLREDMIKGLKLGADDYITKPFDPEMLLLRINNILRRVYTVAEDEYHISHTTLKYNALELLTPSGKEKLTLREAQLLRHLMMNRNKALTREQVRALNQSGIYLPPIFGTPSTPESRSHTLGSSSSLARSAIAGLPSSLGPALREAMSTRRTVRKGVAAMSGGFSLSERTARSIDPSRSLEMDSW